MEDEQRTLRFGEITPRFCHYLRHMNEAPLLAIGTGIGCHPYSRMTGPILPGILEEFSVDESGRRHTFVIRRGLRWSDGVPVTTQDVSYAVNDVLLHPLLRRYLTNSEHSWILLPEWEWLSWGGEPVQLELLDERRFALSFGKPYFLFPMMQVRSARWQMLLRPFHYLKQYHIRYASWESIQERMREDGWEGFQWTEGSAGAKPLGDVWTGRGGLCFAAGKTQQGLRGAFGSDSLSGSGRLVWRMLGSRGISLKMK